MRLDVIPFTVNNTDYYVEEPMIRDGLRATVTLLDDAGNVLHSDRLNLDSDRQRTAFAEKAGVAPADLLMVRSELADYLAGPQAPVEPDGTPRPLCELLDGITGLLSSYVVLSDDQQAVLALWVAHTHAFEAADATAYLAITSAEKRSGKTRLLEMLDLLVARPWLTGRTTAAALARKVDKSTPTLLLDESDTAFGGEKEYAETLRGVLNTGHRRGGAVSVCVGKGADMDVRDFSTFSPKAIAGIGKLPDTVSDRSIPIRMQRKAPGEGVARFRRREVVALTTPIQQELRWWATAVADQLTEARPDIPTELDDRAADGWEPLLAIADMAGDAWPDRARFAAVALSAGTSREDDSLGVKLLASLKAMFTDVDRLATSAIIRELNGRDDEPWGAFNQSVGMRPRDLANMLRRYEVGPRNLKMTDGSVAKGYRVADLEPVFLRYVPETPTVSATSTTSASTSQKQAEIIRYQTPEDAPGSGYETANFPHVQAKVAAVADKTPSNGHVREKVASQGFCSGCDAVLPSPFHREIGQCPACIEQAMTESEAAS